MNPLRAVFLSLVMVASVGAAPLTANLGQGLAYQRAQELPADLPPRDANAKTPLVLDLRYARGDADGASALAGWLKFRATPGTPVFVLANRETARALRDALREFGPGAGVMVIGAESSGFHPDSAVKISPEEERRAYDALAGGTPVAALISDNPDKVRNDEASLSRDRLAEASADAVVDTTDKKPAAPPIDAALQRAVHLHRALRALRKI